MTHAGPPPLARIDLYRRRLSPLPWSRHGQGLADVLVMTAILGLTGACVPSGSDLQIESRRAPPVHQDDGETAPEATDPGVTTTPNEDGDDPTIDDEETTAVVECADVPREPLGVRVIDGARADHDLAFDDDGNVIGGRVYTLQPDEMTPGWLGMAAQSSPHPNGGPSFNVTGTCDYRRVLGEIVEKRLGLSTTQIGSQVFPGFAYGMTPTTMPLGLFL